MDRNALRRLTACWIGLVALTAAVGFLSDFAPRLQQFAVAGIALATLLKTRLVLAHYLGLRAAPGALSGFVSAIAVILVLVAVAIGVTPLLANAFS